MNDSKAAAYARRFDKVFDYIDRHLDEALSVERLSRVANFSKFHFHRQFSDYAGISVTRYVQLTRLKRASYQLVFTRRRIIDIALEAGFENPESFARAFKHLCPNALSIPQATCLATVERTFQAAATREDTDDGSTHY